MRQVVRLLMGAALGSVIVAVIGSGPTEAGTDRKAKLGKLSCRAGEIAKFNGRKWKCAKDETGNGPQFEVRDSNGNVVGQVVDIKDLYNIVIMEVFEIPSTGEKFRVLMIVQPPDHIQDPSSLPYVEPFFESDDCRGIPLNLYRSGTPPAFAKSYRIEQNTSDECSYLFVFNDDTVREITVRSRGIRSGGCEKWSSTRPIKVADIEIVNDDLCKTFPPPYTLHVK